MKTSYKLYLFYTGIILIGASLSAGFYYAYGIRVFPVDVIDGKTGLALETFCDVASFFLVPIMIMLFSAFTVYACFFCGVCCGYVSAVLGRMTIRYCMSGCNPFTHGAALIILLGASYILVSLSKEASECRGSMRTTAPDPKDIASSPSSSALVQSLCNYVIIAFALSLAAFLLKAYFPV